MQNLKLLSISSSDSEGIDSPKHGSSPKKHLEYEVEGFPITDLLSVKIDSYDLVMEVNRHLTALLEQTKILRFLDSSKVENFNLQHPSQIQRVLRALLLPQGEQEHRVFSVSFPKLDDAQISQQTQKKDGKVGRLLPTFAAQIESPVPP